MQPILPVTVSVKKIKGAARQCYGDGDGVVLCEQTLSRNCSLIVVLRRVHVNVARSLLDLGITLLRSRLRKELFVQETWTVIWC